MPIDRYDIKISFEADGDARPIIDQLVTTFGHPGTTVAPASSIAHDDGRVTVRFHELRDEVPATGAEFTPPRPDDPVEAAGRQAIAYLEEMNEEPTALVPIVRALVALSAARKRAGLSPRQHITIDVEPSGVHHQDELRHNRI